MESRTDLQLVTIEQLIALPHNGVTYELIEGELRMMSPAGGRHGRVALKVALLLGNHVLQHDLGAVYAAETGFILSRNPDTVRSPDVAFVAKERVEQVIDDRGYLPFAPDLAIEVISPSDSFSDVEQKAFHWLTSGTRLVLLVDPESKQVHAYRSAGNIVVLGREDQLDAVDIVPDWRVRVAEIFG